MQASHPSRLKSFSIVLAFVLTLLGGSLLLLFGRANAAVLPFNKTIIRLDRLTAATATGGRVCATPSTTNLAQTEGSVQVTFPTTTGTDYAVNATAANWTVDTNNLDAGQTAWPGIGTATSVSAKTVSFPSGDLTSTSNLYCFNFSATNTLTTSSALASETTHGSLSTFTAGAAPIDQSSYSESIITNDQIVLTAVVPPSFAFVLSGNTDSFSSNLSTASVVSTGGRNVTITTNAPGGWIVWVKDLNSSTGKGALQSAIAGNYKIPGTSAAGAASHTLTPGSEDYGLGTTINTDAAGGGTVNLDAAYDGTASKAGTLDPASFRPVASATGTANGDIISLNERATITGNTPAAGDYTDTLTVVGAGQF